MFDFYCYYKSVLFSILFYDISYRWNIFFGNLKIINYWFYSLYAFLLLDYFILEM